MSSTTKADLTHEMKELIFAYIEKNGSITNSNCRKLLKLGYDQVITIFNLLVKSGDIKRIGKTSSTRYVLPDSSSK